MRSVVNFAVGEEAPVIAVLFEACATSSIAAQSALMRGLGQAFALSRVLHGTAVSTTESVGRSTRPSSKRA